MARPAGDAASSLANHVIMPIASNPTPNQRDRQPVERIDRGRGKRQCHELGFVDVTANAAVHLVGHVRIGDAPDRFYPFERRPLTMGKERRLSPPVERVQSLLSLTESTRFLRVHAEGSTRSR
jgi:hypothetical protein